MSHAEPLAPKKQHISALIEHTLAEAARAHAGPAVLDCLLDALRELESDGEVSSTLEP